MKKTKKTNQETLTKLSTELNRKNKQKHKESSLREKFPQWTISYLKALSIIFVLPLLFSISCIGMEATQSENFVESPPNSEEITKLSAQLMAEYESLLPEEALIELDAMVNEKVGKKQKLDLVFEQQADAWIQTGIDLLYDARISAAMWCFLKALEIDPDHYRAMTQVAFVLNYQERYEEAKLFLLFAREFDQKFFITFVNLGYSYRKLGDYPRAIYNHEKAVALHPENPTLKKILAETYIEAGRPDAARPILEMLTQISPEATDIQDLLASLREMSQTSNNPSIGDPKKFEKDMDTFLEVSECFTEAFYSPEAVEEMQPFGALGKFSEIRGDFSEALSLASANALECHTECEQANLSIADQDMCIAGCEMTRCSSLSSAARRDASREMTTMNEFESVYQQQILRYQRCAFQKIFSAGGPKAVPTATASVYEMLTTAREGVSETFQEVNWYIEDYSHEAIQACNTAGDYLSDVNWYDLMWSKYGYDSPYSVEACFIVCLSIQGQTIGLKIKAGAFAIGISQDMSTGHWGVSGSVGIKDPTGHLDLGVTVELNTGKGLGVSGGANVSVGPISRQLVGFSHWSAFNRK